MTPRRSEESSLVGLAHRLTERDRWLLAMLAEHTVLTTRHLTRLSWARGLRAVQARARTLHQHGVIDRFRPILPRGHGSAPLHLLLGPRGAQLLAAETGHTVTDLGYRGRLHGMHVAHRLSLRHDVGVADLVCDLAATPGLTLESWWSSRRCGRCFGHHGARPDAYLTLTTTGVSGRRQPGPEGGARGADVRGRSGWWEMFLEYDTGTETLARLAGKLAGYHGLAAATGIITPVAVWFTRAAREPHARRALAEALRALPRPDLVPVLTGAPLATDTAPGPGGAVPGGRVWLQLHPSGAGVAGRVTLAALSGSPIPTPHPPDSTVADPSSGVSGGVLPAPSPRPPTPDHS